MTYEITDHIFVDIPGYEGLYMINRFGQVWSLLTNRILKPWLSGAAIKYLTLKLSINGKTCKEKVHRLVCRTFHGEPPEGLTNVLHGDDNPINNHADNLRWGTQSDNIKEAFDKGRKTAPALKGEDHFNSKLNDRKVRIIRGLSKLGFTQHKLASMFDVSRRSIRNIVANRSWSHVK